RTVVHGVDGGIERVGDHVQRPGRRPAAVQLGEELVRPAADLRQRVIPFQRLARQVYPAVRDRRFLASAEDQPAGYGSLRLVRGNAERGQLVLGVIRDVGGHLQL